MDRVITPGPLGGTVPAIASKSMAHRLLICAALADKPTIIACPTTSADIEATASCLSALGAQVTRTETGYEVVPIHAPAAAARLDCGESGSTLRFLLPLAAALGAGVTLVGHGRLAQRPLSPLYEQLTDHGAVLGPQGAFPLSVSGRLAGGRFHLPGDVTSQFASGLLMAAPLLAEPLEVLVDEPIGSRPYLDLTIKALERFGVGVRISTGSMSGRRVTAFVPVNSACPAPPAPAVPPAYASPGTVQVEGDWSNAAFWLAAGALAGDGVTVTGLADDSAQGDRAMAELLARFGAHVERTAAGVTVRPAPLSALTIDAGDIPDLVPPLACVAALAQGTTRIGNAGRLRLKESDRLASVTAALTALGAQVHADDDGLTITGVDRLSSGTVDAANDHRIAMMAAVAAIRADGPVTIRGAECVSKSYEGFFSDYQLLGGKASAGKEVA